MDNSSRNIVKFIGAITFAALLIMAARYYADSQKIEAPVEVPEKAEPAKAPEEAADEPTDEAAPDPDNPDNIEAEIVEEDAQLIMGEPSINLEEGGSPDFVPPSSELRTEED